MERKARTAAELLKLANKYLQNKLKRVTSVGRKFRMKMQISEMGIWKTRKQTVVR